MAGVGEGGGGGSLWGEGAWEVVGASKLIIAVTVEESGRCRGMGGGQ